ncbi:MAG TPA: T9SS type A sorting domain-containing protein [Flavobacterium sp.]
MKKTLLFVLVFLCVFSRNHAQSTSPSSISTSIRESQCGTTVAALNSLIAAVCIPQTTAYKFQIENVGTNAIQTLIRGNNYFSLNMLSSYDYATTYSVKVELQVNGVWQGVYGPSCLISSPAVLSANGAAQLSASQCGMKLTNINQLIASNSLPFVTAYAFRVTDQANPDPATNSQIIYRATNWFSLTMLDKYNYGGNYTVEVAVKTTGEFSDFGYPCHISAPDVPGLVSCGGSISDSSTMISTLSLSRVSTYRFEVTDLNSLIATTIDRPINWFSFSQIPDYNPGSSYGVRVSLMTNGTFSDFGDACEISSPSNSRLLSDKATEIPNNYTMQASPNPFLDTFQITSNLKVIDEIDLKAFDMTGRLLESLRIHPGELDKLEFGTNYPSGVYNILISAGEHHQSLKIIKR